VIAPAIFEWLIPTTGQIGIVSTELMWLDGSQVTVIDWGTVENSTEYILEPINITNTGNTAVTLALSDSNWLGIISLTLTWNYTPGTIVQPNAFVIVELTQNVTASGDYSYDTWINATAT